MILDMKLNRNYLYELFMENIKTTYEKAEDLIEDMAKSLDVSGKTIENWLKGKNLQADSKYVKRLAYFFGCEEKYLVENETQQKDVTAKSLEPLSREERESIKKVYFSLIGYIREIEDVLQIKYTPNEIQKLRGMKERQEPYRKPYMYNYKRVKSVFEEEMINMSRSTYEKFNAIFVILCEIEVIKDMYGQNYNLEAVRILIDNNHTDLNQIHLEKQTALICVRNHKAKIISLIRELLD